MGLLQRTCPTEVELADQQSRPHEKTHHHEKRRKMQLIGHLISKELPKNTETHKKNFTITVFKIFKEIKEGTEFIIQAQESLEGEASAFV